MSYPPEVLAGAAVVTVAVVVGVVFLLRALSKPKAAPIGLEERNYQKFKLVKKTMINHNTYLFRFNLQSPQHRVGLPVGKHMLLRFEDANGDLVSRAYTPVTSDDTLGYFELLIKLYDQGKMSQHLKAMNVGDSIDCRGPNGHLSYEGKGQFSIKRKNPTTNVPETVERQVKTISMIAGGSGITPMLQILRDVCKHYPADSTKIALIFGNVTEEDILLRDELEGYAAKFPNVKIHFTLDKPTESWKGGRGFVTAQMIQNNLFPPSTDNIVLLCGPPGMLDAMSRNLASLNYSDDLIFKY